MEKNWKVNRYLGWAIFSTQNKFEEDQPEHQILSAMHCKLNNLDTHYIRSHARLAKGLNAGSSELRHYV